MDVIAVVNQKGGVGKSTTTLGLAGAVADRGKKVLIIDMDPQANASQTVLEDYEERLAAGMFSTNDLLHVDVDPADAHEAILASAWPNVDIIPAVEALATREQDGSTGVEARLKRIMRGIPVYDVVIVDCPPSLGRLTVNALLAVPRVLFVAEPDIYSQQALNRTQTTLSQVADLLDHAVDVAGVVINKVDTGTRESTERSHQIKEQFGDRVLATIPKRTVIRRAAGECKSVFAINTPEGREVADMYRNLADALGW